MQTVLYLFKVSCFSILGICLVVMGLAVVYNIVVDIVDDIKERKEKRHGKTDQH